MNTIKIDGLENLKIQHQTIDKKGNDGKTLPDSLDYVVKNNKDIVFIGGCVKNPISPDGTDVFFKYGNVKDIEFSDTVKSLTTMFSLMLVGYLKENTSKETLAQLVMLIAKDFLIEGVYSHYLEEINGTQEQVKEMSDFVKNNVSFTVKNENE